MKARKGRTSWAPRHTEPNPTCSQSSTVDCLTRYSEKGTLRQLTAFCGILAYVAKNRKITFSMVHRAVSKVSSCWDKQGVKQLGGSLGSILLPMRATRGNAYSSKGKLLGIIKLLKSPKPGNTGTLNSDMHMLQNNRIRTRRLA